MIVADTRTGLSVGLRQPRPTDDPYVLRSSIESIRRGRPYNRMSDHAFHDTVGRRIRDLWSADSGRLRIVACLPEDPDFIIGFVVGDPTVPLVDLIKVRQSFTGQGVATLMLETLGITQDTPARISFPTPDYDRRRSYPLLVPA